MTVLSKPTDRYSYPDHHLHSAWPKSWAKGSELNESNGRLVGPEWRRLCPHINEELFDKAVRDRAHPFWIIGHLQTEAARVIIEKSETFGYEYDSVVEDSSDEDQDIRCDGSRYITNTETNVRRAENMTNALTTCTLVWAPLLLEKGEDQLCICPCASMLQSYMKTHNVHVEDVAGKHCDNILFDPKGLLKHLRVNDDIYHQTAYHMLKQMMTGFHAPTVDHHGINGVPEEEHTPGHTPKGDDDATRHCFTCRVEESDISPLSQRPSECRHSYCSTCWSKWDALPIQENLTKGTHRLR